MRKCENCESVVSPRDEFWHHGSLLCCNCMSVLCSWYLDGGLEEDPDMFAWVIADDIIPILLTFFPGTTRQVVMSSG